MPHVKITELLAEVGQWTSLGDRFWHLRTQAPAKNRQALLTAILADGINLGLSRMSGNIGEGQVKYRNSRVCYATLLSFVLYNHAYAHQVPARQG